MTLYFHNIITQLVYNIEFSTYYINSTDCKYNIYHAITGYKSSYYAHCAPNCAVIIINLNNNFDIMSDINYSVII